MPTFFYVENPVNVVPPRDRRDAPRVGVTFNGTRRDVLIQDVIAVAGPRVPRRRRIAAAAPAGLRLRRQRGPIGGNAEVEKVDRIRREWETFFRQATDGRCRR